MYTREMEERYAATEMALGDARRAHDEVRHPRNRRKGELGELLLSCPQSSGTHGAADWAISNAYKLTEMLHPFVTPH